MRSLAYPNQRSCRAVRSPPSHLAGGNGGRCCQRQLLERRRSAGFRPGSGAPPRPRLAAEAGLPSIERTTSDSVEMGFDPHLYGGNVATIADLDGGECLMPLTPSLTGIDAEGLSKPFLHPPLRLPLPGHRADALRPRPLRLRRHQPPGRGEPAFWRPRQDNCGVCAREYTPLAIRVYASSFIRFASKDRRYNWLGGAHEFRGVLLRINSHRRRQLRARRHHRPWCSSQAKEEAVEAISRGSWTRADIGCGGIPWDCKRLVIGTGGGALPVMDQVKHEAEQRKIKLSILPTAEAIKELERHPRDTNAILHVTC